MNTPSTANRRKLLTLFAAAFALRLAATFALHATFLAPGTTPWQWGHEPACIAQALLDGRGFADPWGHGTGVTAWLTPPYPLFLAFAMKLGGGVTSATAWIVAVLHALASAGTAVALVRLGDDLGHARAGRLAGWLFALYPIALANSAQVIWDTTFVALALTLVFSLVLRSTSSIASAATAGLGYGGLLFLNPAPISLAPAFAWFIGRRSGVRGAALFLACAGAVTFPWMLRNSLSVGNFSLRPNLGVELRIGNHDRAMGHPEPFKHHPSHVEAELNLYLRSGEAEYCAENARRALAWIRTHPRQFVELSVRRTAQFWMGEPPTVDPRMEAGRSAAKDPASWVKFVSYALVGALGVVALGGLRLVREVRILLALSLLCFGGPYYVTHVSERYRFPLDPLLVLLAAALLVQWRERRTARP